MSTSASTSTGQSFNVESMDSTPTLFLHCALFVPGVGIVSDETFRLQTFNGKDSVSTLFEYDLELNGNSSQSSGIKFNFDDIVGCSITVGIQYPTTDSSTSISFQQAINGVTPGPDLVLFNGIVTSFSVKNRGQYKISMKPSLHQLTLTNRYKVYAQKNICDVIKELLDAQQILFDDFGFSPQNLASTRIQDWLQSGESDFEFLQRLLGKAHLYFYIKHTATSHTVVFSNLTTYASSLPKNNPGLRYDYTGTDALGLIQSDVVSEYCYTKTLSNSGVSGILTQQGLAWERNHIVPYVSYLATDSIATDANDIGSLPFNLYKSVQYGGSTDEVADIVSATKSTIASASCALSGSSFCAHLKVAHTITLSNGNSASTNQNPIQSALEQQTFVLTMVSHNANADGSYQNQFQACNANDLITPYSMQETQQGSIIARVVSHGSAAVQDPTHFGAPSSFDPESNQFIDSMNSTSGFPQEGVYVVFSTDASNSVPVWVKLSASMQTVPTIGSIVQVGRAQDYSELPEIQNIIQSNGSMLVIPNDWLANTHVGNSFSTNYGNSKNINYGSSSNANLQQAVGIVNTAYDSGNFDSVGFTQGTNYSFSCANSLAGIASQSSLELYGPTPIAPDMISASETFGSSYSRQHGSMTSNFSVIGLSYSNSSTLTSINISNVGSATNISTVGNTINKNISGNTTTDSVSGDTTETTTSGNTTRTSTSGNLTETTKSGDINQTTTNGNITSSTTSGISINTNTSVASTNITTTGVSTNITTTGLTINTNISADTTNTSISGDTTNITISGDTTNIGTSGDTTNLTTSGNTTNLTISGMTDGITMTGPNNTIELPGPGVKLSTMDSQPHIDTVMSRITTVESIWIIM